MFSLVNRNRNTSLKGTLCYLYTTILFYGFIVFLDKMTPVGEWWSDDYITYSILLFFIWIYYTGYYLKYGTGDMSE